MRDVASTPRKATIKDYNDNQLTKAKDNIPAWRAYSRQLPASIYPARCMRQLGHIAVVDHPVKLTN